MAKKRVIKNPHKKRGRRKPVPGYGGMVGRGVGYLRNQLTTKGSTANWMLKKVKQLADAVNIEYKEFELQTNPTPDFNGTIVNLCVPAQGIAFNQRVGDSIKMQTLTIRGRIVAGPTLAESIRIIVFIDKENQITVGTDMLDNTGGIYATLGAKNEDNKYRSQVLWDRTFDVSPNDRPIINFQEVIQIDVHEHFTAGLTAIRDNSLKLMMISNLSSVSATAQVVWCSYVSYTDD